MVATLIAIILICIMAEIAEWKNNHKDPKWRNK